MSQPSFLRTEARWTGWEFSQFPPSATKRAPAESNKEDPEMRSHCIVALLLVTAPVLCPAASKEIVQLQRDVALLDERVGTLQRSLDEGIGGLRALLQRTLDRVNAVYTADALMERALKDRLCQQEKTLTQPVSQLDARLDQVALEFQSIRATLATLSVRLERLEQGLEGVDNAVRLLGAPAPPPPATALSPPNRRAAARE